MSVSISNKICTVGRLFQNNVGLFYAPLANTTTNLQFNRTIRKHWDPKFKSLRKAKVIKVKLPHFDEDYGDLSKEEIRSRMKERGVEKVRPWMERPVFINATGSIFEPYVPPEGDGKFSAISKTGAKQKLEFISKKGKSMMAVRKIRSFDDEFNLKEFAEEAREIYIKAHNLLAAKDKKGLRQYVTERAYPEMIHNIYDKTLHWKFIQSLEPSRVVQARCASIVSNDNMFAQLTVRFHTQQVLAIYDRFGRLMHGSEILKKDVIEYIVFEKHLSNEYGSWRLHDKIVPSWMPPKEPGAKTFVVETIEKPDTEPEPEHVHVPEKPTEAQPRP